MRSRVVSAETKNCGRATMQASVPRLVDIRTLDLLLLRKILFITSIIDLRSVQG
ncbi:hypothetical protein RSAG8_00463, partial [Rhizoctonia solani AG-8 WAC10335]